MDYISLILNLIISILVAIITAKLSIKDFYKQEIWLRKEERYKSIINELSQIERYFTSQFEIVCGIISSDTDTDLINKKYKTSNYKLEILSTVGG